MPSLNEQEVKVLLFALREYLCKFYDESTSKYSNSRYVRYSDSRYDESLALYEKLTGKSFERWEDA